MKSTTTPNVDLDGQPGYYIRRLQQISVAIFLQETDGFGLTPVQFSALQTVAKQPGVDQRTLASFVGLDTSTVAGVVDRLEARGLLKRSASPDDRRVRLVNLTKEGQALLADVVPHMLLAQKTILSPLSKKEQTEFMRMLRQLVVQNNELSRAPSANE